MQKHSSLVVKLLVPLKFNLVQLTFILAHNFYGVFITKDRCHVLQQTFGSNLMYDHLQISPKVRVALSKTGRFMKIHVYIYDWFCHLYDKGFTQVLV